jgi:hypothetical protein
MIGILFLAVIGAWIWAAAKLAGFIGNRFFPPRPWRPFAKSLVFAFLIFLAVGDEVVGGFQLRALCKENAVLKINAEKIKGKQIRVEGDPGNKPLGDTAIKILWTRLSFRDVETNEELASYSRYVASGGWFIRTLAMGNSVTPMTIFPSSCTAEGIGNLAKNYDFKSTN